VTRRAVVTGAGARVGQRVAVELARHGFHVAVHYRRSEQGAQATLERVRAAGGDGFTVCADLATVQGCRSLCDAVAQRWEGLELLVNNASLFEPVAFENIDEEAFDRMQAVNVRAPFLVSSGLLPLLRQGLPADGGAASEAGLVVHIVDIGAQRPVPGYAHYTVSKGGLSALVRAMAVELAPQVRCVGVSPGQVMWPPEYSDEKRSRLAQRIPMQRCGHPEDIARLIRFLALEAPYINGEIIAVDGGLSARY